MFRETNWLCPTGDGLIAPRRLLAWSLGCFVAWFILVPPPITPPGNVWTPAHTLICIAVVLGAYNSARPGLWWADYLAYGCLAGLYLMTALLPDRRDYIGMGFGNLSPDPYFIRAAVLVVILGTLSLAAAQLRLFRIRKIEAARRTTHCRKCGYLLYGLLEPRCPECGTPFDLAQIPGVGVDSDAEARDR